MALSHGVAPLSAAEPGVDRALQKSWIANVNVNGSAHTCFRFISGLIRYVAPEIHNQTNESGGQPRTFENVPGTDQ